MLTGQMPEEEGYVEVYASREEDADTALVGKLNTISYDALYQKLVLVPLGRNIRRHDLLPLMQQVAGIYQQAAVNSEVEVSEPLMIEGWQWDHALDDGTTGLLANYTNEMKQVIRAFNRQQETDKQTAYIFLCYRAKSGTKQGYMPKKRPYGFVFNEPHRNHQELAKTIAHELGHGLFRLEHTFEAYPALSKGSTANLMDYGKGTRLHKYQWDLVHNPQAMLGWFQQEEEGAMVGITSDDDNVMALLDSIRSANINEKKSLNTTSFIKNRVYTYKGSVTIDEEKIDLLVEHWYWSGNHQINPSQEYSYGHGDQGKKIVYRFDGHITKDKIESLLKIYVDSDKSEQLKSYLFTNVLDSVSVTEIVDFKGYSSADKTGCFRRSQEMLESAGYETVAPNDSRVVQMTKYDTVGNLQAQEKVSEGLAMINNHLDNNKPIVVGVDWKSGHTGNYDKTTDHWIVIVSRLSEKGKNYYCFYDPQTSNSVVGTSDSNRLYIQADKTLKGVYRKGTTYERTYTVTMVRPSVNNE